MRGVGQGSLVLCRTRLPTRDPSERVAPDLFRGPHLTFANLGPRTSPGTTQQVSPNQNLLAETTVSNTSTPSKTPANLSPVISAQMITTSLRC